MAGCCSFFATFTREWRPSGAETCSALAQISCIFSQFSWPSQEHITCSTLPDPCRAQGFQKPAALPGCHCPCARPIAMPSEQMMALQRELQAATVHTVALRAIARAAPREARAVASRGVARNLPLKATLLAALVCDLETDESVRTLAFCILWRKWRPAGRLAHSDVVSRARAIAADPALRASAQASLPTPGGSRARLRVALAVSEAKVALRLVHSNASGAAASAEQIVRHVRESLPPSARSWRSDALLLRLRLWPSTSRKAYAKAFRRRWGVGWRRLRGRNNIPPTELLQRAHLAPPKKNKSGPIFRSQKRPQI